MDRVMVKYNPLHAVLLAAVLITAGIHLYLGIKYADVMFLLNALGFTGLVGLFLIPLAIAQRFHELVRWALIGEAVASIIMWAIINGHFDVVSITAKSAELLVIILLLVDRQRSR